MSALTHTPLSPFFLAVSTAPALTDTQSQSHRHSHTHTHTPAEHLSGRVASSRTPLSHELIGKAIKGSAGPARWRNVLFCYLASKLTKPVRSHLVDAGRALFIYFQLEELDAGSQRCLASNNEAILRGGVASSNMNSSSLPCTWGRASLRFSLLPCNSDPCSWKVVPPIRALGSTGCLNSH